MIDIVDLSLAFALQGSAWVLWLLIILSFISVTIIFDRIIFFYAISRSLPLWGEKLEELLKRGDFHGGQILCDEIPSLAGQVGLEGCRYVGRGRKTMELMMESVLEAELSHLERGLTMLGTLANNGPFIGLFGTVIGIIQAFHELSMGLGGGPEVVMRGISEALVATAVGLLVAIPAVIAFNSFHRVIRGHRLESEAVMHLILSYAPAPAGRSERLRLIRG